MSTTEELTFLGALGVLPAVAFHNVTKAAYYFEEGVESTGIPGLAYSGITGFFQGIWYIVKNLPSFIRFVFKNSIVFMIILSVLIVAGRIDWLLDDIIGLVALSAVLTYATYR